MVLEVTSCAVLWHIESSRNTAMLFGGLSIEVLGTASLLFHSPDRVVKLSPEEKYNYEISDFTNCPCRLDDVTRLIGETWAAIDPSDTESVHNLLTQAAKWGSRCRNRRSFQMPSKYSFFDFAGTQLLAH